MGGPDQVPLQSEASSSSRSDDDDYHASAAGTRAQLFKKSYTSVNKNKLLFHFVGESQSSNEKII